MITLKIKGREYTLEEAQELYEELDQIFGRDRNEHWPAPPPYFPQPNLPTWPQWPIITYDADPVSEDQHKNFFLISPVMETDSAGRISDITLGMPNNGG